MEKRFLSRLEPTTEFTATIKLINCAIKFIFRYAAASAGICYVAADMKIDPDSNRDFAKTQLDYILGDTGRSEWV